MAKRKTSVSLTPETIDYLRMVGSGDVSLGIEKLVGDRAVKTLQFIVRGDEHLVRTRGMAKIEEQKVLRESPKDEVRADADNA